MAGPAIPGSRHGEDGDQAKLGEAIMRDDDSRPAETGASVDEAYGAAMQVWGAHPTAVTVLHVARLGRPGALVEVEATAAIPRS
jgi:hypothetical protein